MSRLIVRNIPNMFSENQLRKHFETVGEVTDVKIVFRGTKNRRFCFIGYKSESDAQAALKKFNKTYIGMSMVDVEMACTKDDPNLPRPWSKYSEQPKKVVKQEQPRSEPVPVQEKSEKFEEFVRLMKKQSTGTMAWSDTMINSSRKEDKAARKRQELRKTIDDIFDETVDAPAVKTVQPTVEPAAAINVDTCRLYVKNIPYNSTEGEVRAVFEKYGTVLQLKLPKGRGGTLTGYCFVTFAKPEEAMRAFTELDNRIVMGRIMHLLPAFEEDKPAEQPVPTAETETSSYKKLKKRDMLERLEDQTSWNTLFLNPNSILESVSRKYNLKKREILSQEGDETAVRVAMAETQVIKETKEWLASVGINLDFMQTDRASCERSKHTILVKNIQYKVDEVQLHELFSHYGKVSKVLLAPNRALGIVQFENETHSQNAFKNLSYYKHQGSYFYLEWAPKAMLKEESTRPIEEEDVLSRIVYVKNLNFNTTEASLAKVFGEYTLVSTKIVRRDGLSLGYGFVEFATVEEAGKAIRRYQNLLLDEHNLQLSQSKPKIKEATQQRKEKVEVKPSTKIVIRNLAFEANVKELRSLVKAYGEVKKLRLPKKIDGQHRGFAFVEFMSLEEARNAYEALQDTHFYGRRLVIEYSFDEEV